MHPVFGLRLAVAAFALRDFVFVMREDEVEPAAVDVERFAEQSSAHGRAFDMPAGAARPQGLPMTARLPWRLSTARSRPGERFRSAISTAFALHAVNRCGWQACRIRVFGDIEIHVPVGLVGEAAFDQSSA